MIMIDELDRLFPKEVVTVFQMIKSNLDLPGLFFVVAMDEEVVCDALLKEGIGKPEYYLQKIFQRKYIINTKHQLMTLTDSFLINYLNLENKEDLALYTALSAFFYQKKEHCITSLPVLPITFYNSSFEGEYENITPINEVEVLASYREISIILREEINLHNPRTFLRFSEILLERWGAFYDYVFQGEEETSYFINVAFLIFVSHYVFPNFTDENHININKKIKDNTPLIIKRLRTYIYFLTPTYRNVTKKESPEIVYYESIIKKSVFYLNKFPDDLKYQNAIPIY
ncbi:hypothetical protein CN442_13075 [Bacillus thuringiensis]|nr:hypothetical protein CN442_13075 [Bacillus thuringiensis]PFK86539.1 hypothetical protein COJ04_24935 [Bacillus thuringiensis]